MRLALLVGFSALTACTSVGPLRPDLAARSVPSRLDEIAYINALREAFVFDRRSQSDGCYSGERLKHFRPTLEQGYPEHDIEQESVYPPRCVTYRRLSDADRAEAIGRYLEAGFGLTDLYCQRYFVIAIESERKRQFQRDTVSTVGVLVNAVLTAASAGETAIGITNAGFGAVESTYKNINTAFLVAPELENVRKLVHAAQQDYRTNAFRNLPGSYESSRSVIERYAGICSYAGMKQLVDDSVSSETKDLVDKTSTTSSMTPIARGPRLGTEDVLDAKLQSTPSRSEAAVLVPYSPN